MKNVPNFEFFTFSQFEKSPRQQFYGLLVNLMASF